MGTTGGMIQTPNHVSWSEVVPRWRLAARVPDILLKISRSGTQ